MLTGAALATINRLPVLLLPSGTFATRASSPVLQELEQPYAADVTVNDAFRPLSRFFDRVTRPEQLPCRPAGRDAGAHRPGRDRRGDHRPAAGRAGRGLRLAGRAVRRAGVARRPSAARAGRRRRTPPPSSGPRSGRSSWSGAACTTPGPRRRCARCASRPAYPSVSPRRARARSRTATRRRWGPSAPPGPRPPTRSPPRPTWSSASAPGGATSRRRREPPSRTRASASSTSTSPGSTPASTPASRSSPTPARPSPRLPRRWRGMPWSPPTASGRPRCGQQWDAEVEAAYHPPAEVTDALAEGLLTQGQVLGAVNELTDPRDVVLCAAGSMPGDLHKLWRVRDRKAYHVEYGYSCMGYEVPASIGIRLADESRDVFAMVGDGGYLMMPTELVTAVQERVKVIVVLVQNHGFHSIGVAVGVAGVAEVRDDVPVPRREDRPARGGAAAGRPRRQRPQPRRPTSSRSTRRPGSSRRSRRPRPRRPTAARSSSTSRPTPRSTRPTASLVGRAGQRGLRARQHDDRLREYTGPQGHPAPAAGPAQKPENPS